MKKEQLMKEMDKFYQFVKKKLNIKRDPQYQLVDDLKNSQILFGKTGGYDPDTTHIYLYYLGRHPKDVLRSFGHECVHHQQNERGLLRPNDVSSLHKTGYALENDNLRKMEEEAYEVGSMLLRDYEDLIKTGKNPLGESKMDKKTIDRIVESIVAKLSTIKEEEKAKKDYDGDGKIETGSQEFLGSKDKAIKAAKAGKKVSKKTAPAKVPAKKDVKETAKMHAKQDVSQRSSGSKEELKDKEKEEAKSGRLHEEEMSKRDEYVYELLLQKFNIK